MQLFRRHNLKKKLFVLILSTYVFTYSVYVFLNKSRVIIYKNETLYTKNDDITEHVGQKFEAKRDSTNNNNHNNYNNNNKVFHTRNNSKSQQLHRLHNVVNSSVANQSEVEIESQAVAKKSVIFIGGYARSGTTLIRAILDVHPSVTCGPETKILPTFLQFIAKYKAQSSNVRDVLSAGLSLDTINAATQLFTYHILANRLNSSAERPCTKDPEILYHMTFLKQLFPNAKFVYMVRDPRGAAYSLMLRYKERMVSSVMQKYFSTWNYYNTMVSRQCESIGSANCKMVKYEDLVLKPNETIASVVSFLGLTWTDEFLHHENHIGRKVVVSDTEWSTNQIKKALYRDALTNWYGNIAYDKRFLSRVKMFNYFGYTIGNDSQDGKKIK